MPRVRLLHWKAAEAREYIDLLRSAGHRVEYDAEFRPGLMRLWRESPPDAFVIDLSRLPSHGREIAILLRQSRATRMVPIVFCEGAEEKIARVRSELPDATYCKRSTLKAGLRQALKHPVTAPVVPTQMMDRYAGRTAAQKLGIKNGSTVALIDAPGDAVKVLGDLPENVEFCEQNAANANVTLCYIHDLPSLKPRLSEVRNRAGATKLWVLWHKGGTAGRDALSERLVRECGIDLGLVDYKICSVNPVWSALAFALKR
jgi:CheY-like chemotaxis protein